MVERLFKLLHQEISGLHEAAFLLAFFALLSKALALLRDRFLAETFGATLNLDIYYSAFRIPDFIYVAIASLVASTVLIPFIVDKIDKKEDIRKFINGIFTTFFASIAFVSVAAFIFMPFLSGLVAPGFSDSAKEELIVLSRIVLISPILLGLSGLFASITQSIRRFFVYALGPLLYNIGIIVGIVFLYPYFGLSGLAYGVVLGALLHLLIQVPVLVRHGLVPRFTFSINWDDIKRVLRLSIPRTLTLSSHHLSLLVLIALASFMTEGSISIFNLSFNLQSVPLSVIGVSYSIAAFPTLARLFSKGETARFVEQVVTAMRHIIFWSLPVLVLFVVLRAQIVRSILGAGEVGWAATRLTAAALALFVLSVLAQSLILLLVRGYYAAGRTIKPLIINVLSSISIIIFALVFTNIFTTYDPFRYFIEALFRVSDIPGTEVLMLPLAFSLGVLINVFVLWGVFRKDFNVYTKKLTKTLRHSFMSSIIMGFAAYQALQVLDNVLDINTFLGIFGQGLFAGIFGILVGVLALRIMGNEEIVEITAALRRKFWRQEHLIPDQDELS